MPTLTCPHCRHHALEPTHHQDVEIDVCTHCGGMWFDNAELDQVIRHYDPDYPKKKPIAEELGGCTHRARWVCPVCRGAFDTHEFEAGSQLQIDICSKCQGIWLEKGELSHAKAYYEIPEAMARINKKRTAKHWFFQFLLQMPVEFNIKPRRPPAVTISLILINVILFFLALSEPLGFVIYPSFSLVPASIGSFGWFVNLITYQFMHGGLLHLAGNMYFLFILGDNLEDALGRIRFVAFYLACGVAGGVVQTLMGMDSQIPIVGASGAIAGVMAGYLYTFRKAKLTFLFIFFQWKLSVFWYFGIWAAINVFGLIMSGQGVAWGAHLGGFAAGLGITALLYPSVIRDNPLISYLNNTAYIGKIQQPAQPAQAVTGPKTTSKSVSREAQ